MHKFGRVAELSLFTLKSSNIAAVDIIATLPAGFRPKYAVTAYMKALGATAGNGIAQVEIRPSGDIKLNWIVAHKDEGNWRWIIGNVLYMTE